MVGAASVFFLCRVTTKFDRGRFTHSTGRKHRPDFASRGKHPRLVSFGCEECNNRSVRCAQDLTPGTGPANRASPLWRQRMNRIAAMDPYLLSKHWRVRFVFGTDAVRTKPGRLVHRWDDSCV